MPASGPGYRINGKRSDLGPCRIAKIRLDTAYVRNELFCAPVVFERGQPHADIYCRFPAELTPIPSERSRDQAGSRGSHHDDFGLVRLYLAFGVILGHYSWIFRDGIVPPRLAIWLICEDGLNAVRAFFIVSGFFLFSSFGASASLGSYLRKRAERGLPAYLTAVLASALLGYFLTSVSAADYFSTGLLKYIFWNSLFPVRRADRALPAGLHVP